MIEILRTAQFSNVKLESVDFWCAAADEAQQSFRAFWMSSHLAFIKRAEGNEAVSGQNGRRLDIAVV